jgi:hypothetical protein
LIFPTQLSHQPSYGLDPSWQLALLHAWKSGLWFGREFVFTYGPLGVLSGRLADPGLHWLIVLSDLFILGNIAWIFAVAWRERTPLVAVITVALSLLCSHDILFGAELVVTLFTFLLFHLFEHNRSRSMWNLGFAILLSLEIFFIKANLGIAAVAAVVGYLIVDPWIGGTIRCSAASLSLYTIGLLTSARLFHVSLIDYVTLSLQLAKGYNDTMMLPFKEGFEETGIIAGIAVILYSVLGVISLARSTTRLQQSFRFALYFGIIFLLFKQSFVRADEHIFTFFVFFPLLLSTCWLTMPTSSRGPLGVFTIGTAIMSLITMRASVPRLQELPSHAVQTFGYFKSAANPAEHLATPPLSPIEPIAPQFLGHIGQATVDTFPWEISQVSHYHLNYKPRLIPQSYAAYTPVLDQRNSESFLDDRAPQFVLFSPNCADYRYCMWDEPRTKAALRAAYHPVAETPGQLLLEKNIRTKRVPRVTPHAPHDGTMDRWQVVPTAPGFLYASFKIGYSRRGLVAKTLYRAPSLSIELQTASGARYSHRILHPMLGSSLLINRFVSSAADFSAYFRADADALQQVKRYRIVTPQRWGFRKRFLVTYRTEASPD